MPPPKRSSSVKNNNTTNGTGPSTPGVSQSSFVTTVEAQSAPAGDGLAAPPDRKSGGEKELSASSDGDDHDAVILESRRLSVQNASPLSVRKSSAPPLPSSSSAPLHEDAVDPDAIGVAKTSNVLILAPPSPKESASVAAYSIGSISAQSSSSAAALAGSTATTAALEQQRQYWKENRSRPISASPPTSRNGTNGTNGTSPATTTATDTATPVEDGGSSSYSETKEASRPGSSRSGAAPRGRSRSGSVRSSRAGPTAVAAAATALQASFIPEQQPKTTSKRMSNGSRTKFPSLDLNAAERTRFNRMSASSMAGMAAGHASRASESSIMTRPRGMSNKSSEERRRDFDTLVQGDETVKYTLTPQNVRDMDVSDWLDSSI